MAQQIMCERCANPGDVEVNGRHFCPTHGRAFLNELIDRWQGEYNARGTTDSRKRYLWFFCILPAMQARDALPQR